MKPFYDHAGITIFHGDCGDVLPELKADVILTDPPYNCGKNYGKGVDDKLPWPEWCVRMDGYLDHMTNAAPNILMFLSQTAWRHYARHGKHDIDWTLVWSKPLSLSVCAKPFLPHWEPILYFGAATKSAGQHWGSDVLTHNVCKNSWGHPTEKPLRLMIDLAKRFEGVILDPFCGSGTTLRAAKDLGRKAIGIEINEEYAEIAARRMGQEVLWSERTVTDAEGD